MNEIRLIASRHSAFYSPLIATIAGGFLEKEGLTGTYQPVDAGTTAAAEVASGRMDVGQFAVAGSWWALEQGNQPAVANFAQINRFDGFIIAAREPDPDFSWSKLEGKRFLHVHGGQPEVMLRYGLHRKGIDLDELDDIDSPGGDEMMRQWLACSMSCLKPMRSPICSPACIRCRYLASSSRRFSAATTTCSSRRAGTTVTPSSSPRI